MKRPADDDGEVYARQQLHRSGHLTESLKTSSDTGLLVNGCITSASNHNSFDDRQLDSSGSCSMEYDKVVILDCGAQYGKVIDRRVRELYVESDILPLNTTVEKLLARKYKAIIISGGPKSVYAADAYSYDPKLFRCGLPVLGICYGLQLINKEFGGRVERMTARCDTQTEVKLDVTCSLFHGLQDVTDALLTHGDVVSTAADGFKPVAFANGHIAAVANEKDKIFGVQFHPEVDLTTGGVKIFENFLMKIARCRQNYTLQTRRMKCRDEIQRTVKNKKVLLLCSGGVDSTVCAALLRETLGKDRIYAIHIDNGFMRKNESMHVAQSLSKLDVNLRVYNESHTFYNATTVVKDRRTGETHETDRLIRITDPETKRRIIGDTFIKVTEEVLSQLNLDPSEVFLAQGTLRPDLIESASDLASSRADAIKTHHNDTELVRLLRTEGRVIEPLKDFHKDEVRVLGRELGLSDSLVMRHPFPGPGLAIRILCATEPFIGRDFNETQHALRAITQYHAYLNDNNIRENLFLKNIESSLSDCEREELLEWTSTYGIRSTLLPVKSVGVQGDGRTYSYVVALSSNTNPIPWVVLFSLARLIPKLLHNINRVVYVFGSAVEETSITDVTPTLLTSTPLQLLREADHVAFEKLKESDDRSTLSQMPIVLVPIHFDRPKTQLHEQPSILWSVVIRTFITNDFMTGIPAVPGKHISEKTVKAMVTELQKVPLISRVMYDLTAKPPGTTEWE